MESTLMKRTPHILMRESHNASKVKLVSKHSMEGIVCYVSHWSHYVSATNHHLMWLWRKNGDTKVASKCKHSSCCGWWKCTSQITSDNHTISRQCCIFLVNLIVVWTLCLNNVESWRVTLQRQWLFIMKLVDGLWVTTMLKGVLAPNPYACQLCQCKIHLYTSVTLACGMQEISFSSLKHLYSSCLIVLLALSTLQYWYSQDKWMYWQAIFYLVQSLWKINFNRLFWALKWHWLAKKSSP